MSGGGSQKTETKIPDYIKQGSKYAIGQAKTLQQQPYVPYTGEGVAPQSADTIQAQQNIAANQGNYQPALGQAGSALGLAAQQFDPAQLQQYMNPYLQQVGNTAQNKINESYDRSREYTKDRAQEAHAYGGSRDAVMQGLNERDRANSVGDMWGALYSQGYNNALNQYNTQKNLDLNVAQGYAGLANQTQQQGLTDANALNASGLQQQQQQQNVDQWNYQQFLNQQQDPYNKLNFYSGILTGQPYGTKTTGGTATSPLSTALGIGTAGASMGNMFGWW